MKVQGENHLNMPGAHISRLDPSVNAGTPAVTYQRSSLEVPNRLLWQEINAISPTSNSRRRAHGAGKRSRKGLGLLRSSEPAPRRGEKGKEHTALTSFTSRSRLAHGASRDTCQSGRKPASSNFGSALQEMGGGGVSRPTAPSAHASCDFN